MIDLSRNESPYPLDDELQKELSRVVTSIHKYPVGQEDNVIESISQKWGIPSGRIMLTRGIDEATDRLIQEFAHYRFFVIVPGFEGFPQRLKAMRQAYGVIQLDDGFCMKDESLGVISAETFVFLASPNNPTGLSICRQSLSTIVDKGADLLVDETYVEFQEEPSQLSATNRMFVYRSFSKCYALAGLRLGILIGPETAITSMRSRQWYCNMDVFALRAIDLLLHSDLPSLLTKRIIAERERLAADIALLGLKIRKTVTNFVLVEHPAAVRLKEFLLAGGVIVRLTESMGLRNHIRVSVGSAAENRRVVERLSEFVYHRRDIGHG